MKNTSETSEIVLNQRTVADLANDVSMHIGHIECLSKLIDSMTSFEMDGSPRDIVTMLVILNEKVQTTRKAVDKLQKYAEV